MATHALVAFVAILALSLLAAPALGDVYMHNPRGSNNRLNERSANRNNGNRMFDSQNNNRGGYNKGDVATAAFQNYGGQYDMFYYSSAPDAATTGLGRSILNIEWTNQHGCGGNEHGDPHKLNCNLLIQYMCQPVANNDPATGDDVLRDGLNTNRQDYTNPNKGNINADRKTGNVRQDRGLHETWDHYDECYRRERNRGLFTADQNLRNNNLGYSSAVYTRQNPNNNRRGYECPEERDYWPYWHPSPWRDIVVMTDRLDLCPFYQSESQNVKAKFRCTNTNGCNNCLRYNNEAQCSEHGGNWVRTPAHGIPPPECIQAPWSRVNHLGNGRHGQPNTYNWTIPHMTEPQRCVVRLRYNISTDDYDAWRVNASFNNNNGQGIESPVRQNPNVNLGAENQALRLAINTAQFGRTFQDRSHVIRIIPRQFAPGNARSSIQDATNADFFSNPEKGNRPRTIYNINVRGKRGNIVQTFPSVEYDFVPNQLHITEDDLVHFQWTGSNTHNNGNPAGDGQAGDAGEGTGGTDRHNVVELKRRHFGESFPATWEENTMFDNLLDVVGASRDPNTNPIVAQDASAQADDVRVRWALRMATAGYMNTPDEATDKNLNPTLNNAPASFSGGLFRFRAGHYNYMCTRNHNFSNRDQKGVLTVDQSEPIGRGD